MILKQPVEQRKISYIIIILLIKNLKIKYKNKKDF